MNFLALILCAGLLGAGVVAQTVKPAPARPKANTTASKSSDNKAKKPGTSKSATTKKTAANSDAKKSASSSKGTAPKVKTPERKPKTTGSTAAKPKPKAKPKTVAEPPTPEEIAKADAEEEAEYEAAAAVEDGPGRISALKKFLKAHPNGKRRDDATAMIVTVTSQLGNDRLGAADVAGAVEFYKAAITDSPQPMPDPLFNDTLAKFPINVFFRGGRTEAYDLARQIEQHSGKSLNQLLSVATFYMNVENGSEARRVVEKAIKLEPTSGKAYQSLGLAFRMDFMLDESVAAYAKALELEPESLTARRGLAEMKRALAKPDEAVVLYKEILAKDEADLASRTGFILALFDAGKKSEAEAELARALEANPGNVILQAGAAYWYAVNGEGEKAVDLAQKAITADPRFIWSHIALARGQIASRDPIAAEKTLLSARRYGNFPTLEYEIANARAAAGFFREAADELAKSFTIKDGLVHTNLGGRISRGSKDIAELIGYERRASIFAPISPDDTEHSARMLALLDLKQQLDKEQPNADAVVRAADEFTRGDDKMKAHRLIFAGSQLLEKKLALPKVVEISKTIPKHLESGLDVADPSAAIMASEIYEARKIAAARGDYVNVPPIPRATLSQVLRGRVEEITGWAHYQMDETAQAAVHLKRAVGVLPVDSAWWRSSTWRLGAALALEGKNQDALEMYVRSYKSAPPDALKYSVIEALYRRINGHVMGLENVIGANPSQGPSTQAVAQAPRPTPAIPMAPGQLIEGINLPSATASARVPARALAGSPIPTAAPTATTRPTPDRLPEEAPQPTPESSPTPVPTVEPSPTPTPEPIPSPEPTAEPSPTATPEAIPSPQPSPTPSATPGPAADPSPTPERRPALPSDESTARVVAGSELPPTATKEQAPTRRLDNDKGLFPPVIIEIPQSPPARTSKSSETVREKPKAGDASSSSGDGRARVVTGVPTRSVEVEPCSLTLDQDSISLQSTGTDRVVVVRRTDDGDIDGMTATSVSDADVSVRRESLPGVKWTALFVLKSLSGKPGLFQVRFEAPCGKKEVMVRVQ